MFIWFGFFSLLHCERGGVILYLVSLFLGVFIWAGLVYKFLHCEREEAGRFGGVLVFGFWDILGCLHC